MIFSGLKDLDIYAFLSQISHFREKKFQTHGELISENASRRFNLNRAWGARSCGSFFDLATSWCRNQRPKSGVFVLIWMTYTGKCGTLLINTSKQPKMDNAAS